MKLLKKKYMYIHTFSENRKADGDTLLGFHYGSNEKLNFELVNTLKAKSLLPVYGFSFYENPPGRILRHGNRTKPAMFRSENMHSYGTSFLVKIIPSSDMFNDYGLSFYRSFDFMMIIGKNDALFNVYRGCFQYEKSEIKNHPLVCFFSERIKHECNDNIIYGKTLENQNALLETAGDADYESKNGYADCVYILSDLMTSLVLSHKTINNLIENKNHGLEDVLQVPVPDENYEKLMESVFQFNSDTSCRVAVGNEVLPLGSISPAFFGFKNTVLDLAKRTVTGKRAELVSFLLHLNERCILDRSDLRYFV